jgi:hypothetical protein
MPPIFIKLQREGKPPLLVNLEFIESVEFDKPHRDLSGRPTGNYMTLLHTNRTRRNEGASGEIMDNTISHGFLSDSDTKTQIEDFFMGKLPIHAGVINNMPLVLDLNLMAEAARLVAADGGTVVRGIAIPPNGGQAAQQASREEFPQAHVDQPTNQPAPPAPSAPPYHPPLWDEEPRPMPGLPSAPLAGDDLSMERAAMGLQQTPRLKPPGDNTPVVRTTRLNVNRIRNS